MTAAIRGNIPRLRATQAVRQFSFTWSGLDLSAHPLTGHVFGLGQKNSAGAPAASGDIDQLLTGVIGAPFFLSAAYHRSGATGQATLDFSDSAPSDLAGTFVVGDVWYPVIQQGTNLVAVGTPVTVTAR